MKPLDLISINFLPLNYIGGDGLEESNATEKSIMWDLTLALPILERATRGREQSGHEEEQNLSLEYHLPVSSVRVSGASSGKLFASPLNDGGMGGHTNEGHSFGKIGGFASPLSTCKAIFMVGLWMGLG